MAHEIAEHELTLKQLRAGVPFPTGKRHVITVRSRQLIVRLEMDPNASLGDQKFTLIGGATRDAAQYTQTRTGKDDLIKGDKYLDIRFTKLVPDVKYWLEVDPGGGAAKYLAFEAEPWSKIGPPD